jgi:DNA-3-methyladenine glycosylase I
MMQTKDALCRCPWVDLKKLDYVAYHDREWGVPIHDDRRLFEFLILEGAQAGLSWGTVSSMSPSFLHASASRANT